MLLWGVTVNNQEAWSYCIVVVNDCFFVIQFGTGDALHRIVPRRGSLQVNSVMPHLVRPSDGYAIQNHHTKTSVPVCVV